MIAARRCSGCGYYVQGAECAREPGCEGRRGERAERRLSPAEVRRQIKEQRAAARWGRLALARVDVTVDYHLPFETAEAIGSAASVVIRHVPKPAAVIEIPRWIVGRP